MITWEKANAAGFRLIIGLNLTVFGLIAATEISESEPTFAGEELIAPTRSSEKDVNLEHEGFEATGLAITILSGSLLPM